MQTQLEADIPVPTSRPSTYGLQFGNLLVPWLPASLVLVAAGLAAASPIAGDSWLALVGGREIVRHGLPSHDTLSSLGHGRQWIDQAWLGQLVLYAAYSIGGLGAVTVIGRIAVTGAELVALGTVGRRRSSPLAVMLALVLAFTLLGARSEIRPQLLAEPLFALLLWLLVDEARGPTRRVLWAAPLILVVWANVHGSVLLGSGLLLLAVAVSVGTMLRRSTFSMGRVGWLTFVAVAAPFANPYGPRLLDYYSSVLGNDTFSRLLSEWSHSTPSSAPFECAAVAVVAVFVVAQWRRTHPFDSLVLIALAAATMIAQRNAVWLALAIAALLPPLVDGVLPSRLQLREIRGAAALFLLAGLVGIGMLGHLATTADSALAKNFPASASPIVTAIRLDPHAEVLATPSIGDWLLFQAPALEGHIVADGRFEVLSSQDFFRLIEVLDGARTLRTTFPRARILALTPGTALERRALELPGARRIADEPNMIAITLPDQPAR